MSHACEAERVSPALARAWGLCAVLQTPIVLWERYGSQHSGSATLWSYFLHDLSDVMLLAINALVALLAWRFAQARFDVMTAAGKRRASRINVTALFVSGAWSCQKGWTAFKAGHPVEYDQAWYIAAVAALVNIVIYVILRKFQDRQAETFSWHVFWDVIASVGGSIGLVAGIWFGHIPIDAWLAMIIGVLMIFHWPVHWMMHRQGHHGHQH